jgi:hypothetical protein
MRLCVTTPLAYYLRRPNGQRGNFEERRTLPLCLVTAPGTLQGAL